MLFSLFTAVINIPTPTLSARPLFFSVLSIKQNNTLCNRNSFAAAPNVASVWQRNPVLTSNPFNVRL